MMRVKKDIGKERGRLKCAVGLRFLKPTCPVRLVTQQMSNSVKGCEIIKGTLSISIQD